jgi:hypothetical protein
MSDRGEGAPASFEAMVWDDDVMLMKYESWDRAPH